METSVTVSVPTTPPLTIAADETARAREPLATRRPTTPDARERHTPTRDSVDMHDGGIAFALDACDDLAPHWVSWMEYVDARCGDRYAATT